MTAPCTLERFAAAIEAMRDAETATLGPRDARAIERRVRLARVCEVRGRRLIAGAANLADYARGISLLAAHYMLEMNTGHMVMHGGYDRLAGSAVSAATHDWRTAMVPEDWVAVHNPAHHVWTNQVGRDLDFGFEVLRLSGRTPWRAGHLLQPALFAVLSLNMTLWLPSYPAIAHARLDRRPVWTRRTFAPVVRKVLAEWRRNYVSEPRRAGVRFPRVVIGNYCAKLAANVFIGCLVGLSHHAGDLVEFDADADGDDSIEAAYLRQVLATQNWTTTRRHEDVFSQGVSNHIEHHLFPELPLHRLRGLQARVAALCAAHGIPYRSRSLPRAVLAVVGAIATYALPVRTTPARERTRAIYRRLIDELRATRAQRARDEPPVATTYAVRLARTGITITAPSQRSLLESIEAAGVAVPSDCHRGACKTCSVGKLAGRTTLERYRVRTTIELCVARPISDLVLDI
jgi:fatty acid desaturase/ferredoxin